MSEDEHDGVPAAASATVVALRDGPAGLEVLLVRRNPHLDFYGGAWAFPGGRVEPADVVASRGSDVHDVDAGRVAAVRELAEETRVHLDAQGLIPWSHWTTPPSMPKRFATWFYLAVAAGTDAPVVDGGEIQAASWESPAQVLHRFRSGELELAPPTWLTLTQLDGHDTVASVVDTARQRRPEVFRARIGRTAAGDAVSAYEQDAGWHDGDFDRPGPRHRIVVRPGDYRYERAF